MQAKTAPVPRRRPLGNGVYLRPEGSYEIGWRDSTGKQRWKSPFRTKREAQAARAEEVARRARGEKVATDPRLSFNAAADAWVDARVSRLKPNTRSAYDAGLKHLRPVFGRRRVMDIAAGDLANYISAKQAEGLKAWTVKSVKAGIAHAARYDQLHRPGRAVADEVGSVPLVQIGLSVS